MRGLPLAFIYHYLSPSLSRFSLQAEVRLKKKEEVRFCSTCVTVNDLQVLWVRNKDVSEKRLS